MKRFVYAAGMIVAMVALGGTIKTFTAGDILQPSDLNYNYTHIHNLMVGGHGARLVDADVNGGAAISYYKMKSHKVVPKLVAYISCSAANACATITFQGGISSTLTAVTSVAGDYTTTGMVVSMSPALTDAVYAVSVQSLSGASLTVPVSCYFNTPTTGSFKFMCYASAGTPGAGSFLITIYDDN